MWPSKVGSYLEVNAWTDWQQQDLISECVQGLAYKTHKYYTRHIILVRCEWSVAYVIIKSLTSRWAVVSCSQGK